MRPLARLLGRTISPSQGQDNRNTETWWEYIHVLSGIRNHDPRLWAIEDSIWITQPLSRLITYMSVYLGTVYKLIK